MQTITEIPTTAPHTYAFRIAGEVKGDDMEAMAERMNAAFDTHDKVNMLLIFDFYDGAETGASFNWESIKSRFRSVGKVDKYVVVGAPKEAENMVEGFGSLLPVDAQTFEMAEIDRAWETVGARPA